MEYRFEKISPEKYKDIQSLKNRSMGYLQDMEDIERKYNTSSFGSRDIGFFARDNQNFPAAYYGVFPIRASYDGKDMIIAQSGDTMTDPDHRKKGLFTKLAKETYDFAGKNGISFVFGFPNEFSYPGFKKKLDWIFFGNMQEFSFQTKAFPLCELAKKFPKIRPFYKFLLNNRISKYKKEISEDNIRKFSFEPNTFCIKKDINFYNYKKGSFKYIVEINGFTLFIKAQTHLYIGDVAKFDTDKTMDFIIALNKLSKIVLSKKVVLTVSKTHWLYELLKNQISPKESLPIGFYKYSNDFPFEKMIISMSDYDTF